MFYTSLLRLGSSTCPLTGFFGLWSHVTYLKLRKVLYEFLLSHSWLMGRRTFSVSQQLMPELFANWMLSIFSDLPLTRKTEKTKYFSMKMIKLTKSSSFSKLPSAKYSFWCNLEFCYSSLSLEKKTLI